MIELDMPEPKKPNQWQPRKVASVPTVADRAKAIDTMVKQSIAIVDDFIIKMIYQK